MKIPNKGQLPQIAINHSSDIDFKEFINLHKKCTEKPYFFLINENPLHFGQNLLERIDKVITLIDDNIRVEKLQYNINTEKQQK